jgi:CHAD domain-containing protein
MVERELKLHVPEHARAAVMREMRKAGARKITLQALYFDTPDRALANAGVALRLRKEGRRWVQTAKAAGQDVLSRLEINHVRPGPELDLSLYAGGPLEAFFGGLQQPLAVRYETRITRQRINVSAGDTSIEVAFDQGFIVSGPVQLPVRELEFELCQGDVNQVFIMGGQWLSRHGLILDLRSKAERGDALADAVAGGVQQSPASDGPVAAVAPAPDRLLLPRKAADVRLRNKMSIQQAYAICATECLEQIIRNAAMSAGVDTDQADDALMMEYVHQLRVGIRRLRSCWKLFKGTVAMPEQQVVDALKQGFAALGSSRDLDVVRTVVAPLLQSAGMPTVRLPRGASSHRGAGSAHAADSAFQHALLHILHGLVCLPDPGTPDKGKALRPQLVTRLDRWLRRIVKAGARFTELPVDQQHGLRKAVKALRYSIDFCQGILPPSATDKVRGSLVHVQEILGELNDFYVASGVYQKLTPRAPQAWFALGWLSAMQARAGEQAQQAFGQMPCKLKA